MNIRKTTQRITGWVAGLALASVLLASCSSTSPTATVSVPQPTVGKGLVGDTLSSISTSTFLSGNHTYYFKANVVVPAGDTLLLQKGINLVAVWDSSAANPASPEIDVEGTFISLGTSDAPNYIGPVGGVGNKPDYADIWANRWGGIAAGKSSGDVIIKWTHLFSAGGSAGTSIEYASGAGRFMVKFINPTANLILEDSWFRGCFDDCVRTNGGHLSIMRNTFEFDGGQGGEAINIKGSCIGDIAYNMVCGNATNGWKLAYPTVGTYELNCNMYNNTAVNSGWRMIESGRAGSTDMETGARGSEYNNLIVNCKTGFQLLPSADTANTYYAGMEYYGMTDTIQLQFYPPTGVQRPAQGDIAGAPGALDPQFVNYNVTQYDYTQHHWPINAANQPNAINEQGTSDFHLKSSSPGYGKGLLSVPAKAVAGGVVIPMKAVPQGGPFGATEVGLGKDMGAYQSDGTGNQH
jgi:hypothetical protein